MPVRTHVCLTHNLISNRHYKIWMLLHSMNAYNIGQCVDLRLSNRSKNRTTVPIDTTIDALTETFRVAHIHMFGTRHKDVCPHADCKTVVFDGNQKLHRICCWMKKSTAVECEALGGTIYLGCMEGVGAKTSSSKKEQFCPACLKRIGLRGKTRDKQQDRKCSNEI